MFKQDCTCFCLMLNGNHTIQFFFQSFLPSLISASYYPKDLDGSYDIFYIGGFFGRLLKRFIYEEEDFLKRTFSSGKKISRFFILGRGIFQEVFSS